MRDKCTLVVIVVVAAAAAAAAVVAAAALVVIVVVVVAAAAVAAVAVVACLVIIIVDNCILASSPNLTSAEFHLSPTIIEEPVTACSRPSVRTKTAAASSQLTDCMQKEMLIIIIRGRTEMEMKVEAREQQRYEDGGRELDTAMDCVPLTYGRRGRRV